MVKFVNAKINIGLQIVEKRSDGYHNLQTVFYPVGLYGGTPFNPTEFCDILETVPYVDVNCKPGEREKEENAKMPVIEFRGRKIECPPEKNLVTKAARMFMEETGLDCGGVRIILDKHLPDGAGMGGGSADATFTLISLAENFGIDKEKLSRMAAGLGADCPFFLENRAVYAEGIGDRMSALDLDLTGYWLVVIKPDVFISTAEAFRGVTPRRSEFDLRKIADLPIEEWRKVVTNDFEESIIPRFPIIGKVKERLYRGGALYSSMTGSGSAVYGIFQNEEEGKEAMQELESEPTITAAYLLKL